MPQWRKLHESVLTSFDVNEMPDDFTRLFWVLLPLKVDKAGRGVDNVAWLHSMIFPMREDVTDQAIDCAFNWFTHRGMIERYEVDGRRYFWIPTFGKYQGNTSREADSRIPAPPIDARPTPAKVDEPDEYTQDQDTNKSRPSHDLVVTRSLLDADADADIDADTDAEPAASVNDAVWSEILDMLDHFVTETKITPPTRATKRGQEALRDKWLIPLRDIRALHNSDPPGLITRTVAYMRENGLTVANPGSIINIARTLHFKPVANGRHTDSAADSEAWRVVLAHAARGDPTFSDERIKTAVRSTGWPELQAMKPGSFQESQLKEKFLEAYHGISERA